MRKSNSSNVWDDNFRECWRMGYTVAKHGGDIVLAKNEFLAQRQRQPDEIKAFDDGCNRGKHGLAELNATRQDSLRLAGNLDIMGQHAKYGNPHWNDFGETSTA